MLVSTLGPPCATLCQPALSGLQRGLARQADGEAERIRPMQRTWLIMPFMHSETLADQQVRRASALV